MKAARRPLPEPREHQGPTLHELVEELAPLDCANAAALLEVAIAAELPARLEHAAREADACAAGGAARYRHAVGHGTLVEALTAFLGDSPIPLRPTVKGGGA